MTVSHVCHLHTTKAWDVIVTGRWFILVQLGCIPEILLEVLVGAHKNMALDRCWDWLVLRYCPKSSVEWMKSSHGMAWLYHKDLLRVGIG